MSDVHNALLLVFDHQVHDQESQIEKTKYVSLLCAREERQLQDYEFDYELHGLSELYGILALYLHDNLASQTLFFSLICRYNELIPNLITNLLGV